MPNPFANISGPIKLLIVTPDAFANAVAPLVTHKNATGMPAFAASISSIKSFFGTDLLHPGAIDDAAAIKSAIKYARENLSTQYVLLLGDAMNCPIRFWFCYNLITPQYPNTSTSIPCNPNGTFFQSDLYYSNLYHHSGTFPNMVAGQFDSWTQSGTGLYNRADNSNLEWNPDNVDGYPDIAVGRVPAANAGEVSYYVSKVIAYETSRVNPFNALLTYVHDEQYGSFDLTTNFSNQVSATGWNPSTQYLLLEDYPSALSLASFGGALWVAFVAGDNSGNLLMCSSTNGTSWPTQATSTKRQAVKGPALEVFAAGTGSPALWMAYASKTDSSGNGSICVCSSGDNWASTITISASSYEGPALVVFQNSLFLAYTGDDNQIYTCSSTDGKSWPTTPVSSKAGSASAPAMAAFKPSWSNEPLLWIAFVANNASNSILITYSTDGQTGWSTGQLVASPVSATAPSLAVFGGQLWVAYAAGDGSGDVLVYSSPDGKTWSQSLAIPNQASNAAPSLTVFMNSLWIGFVSASTNYLNVCSLAAAGDSWSTVTVLPQDSRNAIAPFVGAVPAAVAAAVGKSFWVSYTGHGGIDVWGHIGLFSEQDVLLTNNTSGFPVIFVTGCQTAQFAWNLPGTNPPGQGVQFMDTQGNLRGPFAVAPTASLGKQGVVIYEGAAPPNQTQSWGSGPGYTQAAPPGSLHGNWLLPFNCPLPNAYSPAISCIGKTWLLGTTPGGSAATGGAIAYFGLHDVDTPGKDIEVQGYLLSNYVAGATDVPVQPNGSASGPVLGDLYLKAQQSFWGNHQNVATDVHSLPRLYLGWLVFFGDPSLRLPPISVEHIRQFGGGGGGAGVHIPQVGKSGTGKIPEVR